MIKALRTPHRLSGGDVDTPLPYFHYLDKASKRVNARQNNKQHICFRWTALSVSAVDKRNKWEHFICGGQIQVFMENLDLLTRMSAKVNKPKPMKGCKKFTALSILIISLCCLLSLKRPDHLWYNSLNYGAPTRSDFPNGLIDIPVKETQKWLLVFVPVFIVGVCP